MHRFSYRGKPYIFDYENLVFAELDELFEKCFDYIENKVSWEKVSEEFGEAAGEALSNIEEFVESGTFFSAEKRSFSLPGKYSVGLISLPPVHNCNLRCTYCFAEQGKVFAGPEKFFTKDILEKALRYIYYEYLPDCKKYRIDFISGGEPLLNFDIIKQVKEISDTLFQETGKQLEIWLCTNGTCFTDDIIDFLDKNHISIGISLDGDERANDLIRIDAAGRGTYERIVNSIRKIKTGEYSKNLKDIWGMVVITSKTQSLKDILIHHRKIGLKNVQMKIVRLKKNSPYSVNSGNIEKIKGLYDELFDFFTDELEKSSIEYVKMILNDNDFAGKIVRRLLMRYLVLNRCQAGKNKVSIAANGDMYPCDSFVGMEQFRLGNVLTGVEDENRFCKMSVCSNSVCTDCWARFVCGGDCYHNSYLVNDEIDQPDGVICQLEKHIIYRTLIYLNEMAEKHLNLYEYLQNLLSKREIIKQGGVDNG